MTGSPTGTTIQMNILESKLVSSCLFRGDGIHCHEGILWYSNPGDMQTEYRVMVEGEVVTCSACDGKGYIVSPEGKQILLLLEVAGRSFLRDLVDELFEEREQH